VTSHSISTSTAEWLHKKRPTSGVFWRTSRKTQRPCAIKPADGFATIESRDLDDTTVFVPASGAGRDARREPACR